MSSILEPQRSDHSVMTMETLRATIDFFCSHQNEIEFIWHGGEPLLARKEFYREVVRLQEVWRSRDKKIANFLQTSGVLVDEEWSRLLAQLGFHVGVSLDAPAAVHDTLRVMGNGFSSLKKTLDGIIQLEKFGIFNGVSCCVGKSNHEHPEEVINYFLEHGIKSIKFLRIKGDSQEVISADQYATFMIKVFNIWLELDDPALEIRDIKSIVDLLLGGDFRECTFMGRCDQFVTVYNDGSIFPCDSFLNEPHLQFGTVFDPYTTVLENYNFQAFLTTMEKSKETCRSCRWYTLCNGGCSRDRLSSCQGEVCRANQRMFEEIEKTLRGYGLLEK